MSVLSNEWSCSWIVMRSSQVSIRRTNSWETKEQKLQVSSEEDLALRNIPCLVRTNIQKMLKTKTEIDVNAFLRGGCSPSPGFTQKPGCESLPWGPGQEQGRIPSSDAGLSPDITGFVCSQAQWGSRHCWFYRRGWSLCAGMCWGPALFMGRKNTYSISTNFLKSSCKNVFKNLFSLSFINHMNHQWKDLGKFCDDTKLKEIACSETRHSSAAGHQALLHQEKSLHTPKDGAEMKSSNYLDIAVGNWLAGCFHESFFKSDLPDPQKSKGQLK